MAVTWLTLVLLTLVWFGLRALVLHWFGLWFSAFVPSAPDWTAWLGIVAAGLYGLELAAGLAFLIAPVTALVGSFFMDQAAAIIEQEDYPAEKPGKPMPAGRSLVISCRFVILSLAGNLLALALLFVPGINMVAFLVINGMLPGREYFEFAAARFMPYAQVRALYRQHFYTVFLAGIVIALFLSLPLLNLLTPLFAAALMTHLHKFLAGSNKQKQFIS